MDENITQELEWKWCLVGNIVQERDYGENHEVKLGTKHFSPGTKVYCAPGHWGDGGENIVVIGKHRGSPQYIENFCCQKVFKPAVLKLMEASKWGFWNDSDDHRVTITKMAEGLNLGRFD